MKVRINRVKLTTLMMVAVLIIPLANLLGSVSASSLLTLKWRVHPSNTITIIGPQAAELIPSRLGMQIVITGGSTLQDGADSEATAHGAITVLDGTNGNVIWSATGFPIGIHQPFEIADLNKDGNLEILSSAWSTTLALFGNNGSVYWRINVPSDDLTPAIADVNGDGFPEIFVSSGNGPYRGYDWITSLSHDGNILHQAFSWHPCFGGLSIADPSFDGHFMLFQGDRSNKYNGRTDGYKGGGRGVRALDALTLTPIWNDPTILCSSYAPILADVDKNGILDVIVADQTTDGIAVLNSSDGTVLTNYANGIRYRKGATDMPAHSQPTVYDIDGDGNLELIDNTYSQVMIWDLYEWKSDGNLKDENGNPLFAAEPPKIGNVTGDQGMNVIAVPDSSPQNPYVNQRNSIYIYDKNYRILQKLTGLDDPRSFTLVQDVDGDGLNELVVTSGSGNVYCYDTQVQTPEQGITSTSEFYSEYRRGAAEYVQPLVPAKPVLRDERPQDGSLNETLNPVLSVQAIDFQGDLIDINFRTNVTGTWTNMQSYQDVSSGTYTAATPGMDENGTTYYWEVVATDSKNNTNSQIYRFTTQPNPVVQGYPFVVSSQGQNRIGGNLLTYPNGSDVADQTNIYNWYTNGTSQTNLLLPFDSHTSDDPLISDTLFNDGLENGYQRWNANGGTDWKLDQTQAHGGSTSARATSGVSFLTSNNIDTSSADGITVSFWYRDHGTGFDDNVYLQFWNGLTYNNIFKLGNTQKDTWHYYTVQTYDPQYSITNFRIRFDATTIDRGRTIWIDDVSVEAPRRTIDYSGRGNHGTVHDATWTSQGIVGGAYIFDGLNDYISIPDNPSLGGDGSSPEITVEFWTRPLTQLWGATIITKRVAGQNSGSYTIGFLSDTHAPANTLFWGINSTSDNAWHEISDTSTTVLQAGNWYHIVCTYKSDQGLLIYINGTRRTISQSPLTGNIAPGSGVSIYKQPVFIGYDGGGDSTRWFKGILDEIRIYPKSMSQFQVLQRYGETRQGLSNSSTIAGQDTNVGDVWKCQVTPNNGFVDGSSKFTDDLILVLYPVQYSLVVGVSGSGSTDPAGSHMYDAGTAVSVSATADSDWIFDHWLLDGVKSGSANPFSLTMNANHTLTAVLTVIPSNQWKLTVSSVHGNPDPSVGDHYYADSQLINCSVANPVTEGNTIWTCIGWTGTGSVPSSGSGSSTTFIITQNSTITWNWQGTPAQYKLTVDVSGSGSTIPTGSNMYNAGTVVSVSATANSGWTFSNWLLGGVNSGSANPFSLTMNANHTLTAVFTVIPPAQYLFSSDFETGSFSEWDGTVITSGETAAVVQTLPHSGSCSALFTTDGGSVLARAYAYKNVVGVPEIYSLAYVYFDGTATISNSWNSLWLIQFRDSGGSTIASFGISRDQTSTKWTVMYGGQSSYAAWGPIANTWYCVQAYFRKASSGKTLVIYVDGQEVASLSVNTSGVNNVSQVRLGITYNDPSYLFKLYVDTVIVDSQYILPPSSSYYSVGLQSREKTDATQNLGAITFSGSSYGLPSSSFKAEGSYSIQYSGTAGYAFDHWETSGMVSVYDALAVSTMTTVAGNGTIRAVYSKSAYVFSSDFETGSFSEWDGTAVTSGETATVVQTLPHSGTYGARFTTDGGSTLARAYAYKNIPSTSQLYALAYVYFDGTATISNSWNSLWLIQFRDSGGSTIASFGISRDQTSTKWTVMYGGQTAYATWGPVPGVWYSVEAYFNKTASGKALIIYVNGVEAASLSINTSGANDLTQVRIGIAYNDPSYTFNIYLDAAIIDNKYISQPP